MKFEATVSLEEGVRLLKQGDVVALPTETVYGLAADIHNEAALKKVFAVKARPYFDPLIVHVNNIEQALALSADWTELHDFLARRFWPGPLTLITQKSPQVLDIITSGLDTVAVRWPEHPIFRQAIDLVGVPLAAPSANLFGKTSPTSAEHVLKGFNHELPVVDGGPARIGLESTVVLPLKQQDSYRLEILRHGGITSETLKAALKDFSKSVEVTSLEKQNSPGHLKHHYQPDKPLMILDGFSSRELALAYVQERAPKKHSWRELQLDADPLTVARELYKNMRDLSELKGKALFVIRDSSQQGELWAAIWDRLEKASSEIISADTLS